MHFKNLSKFVEIAREGRVSNPVPGSEVECTGIATEIAEPFLAWRAEDLVSAAMLESELDLPENAM